MTFEFPPTIPLLGGRRAVASRSSATWHQEGGIEQHGLAAVAALAPVGGVFVDVGANIGYYSVAAATAVGARGKVHALEPSPDTFELLCATIEVNDLADRVELHRVAAGATTEVRTLFDHDIDLLSSLRPGLLHSPGSYTEHQVEQRTIDDIVSERVDMMKIDVEGAEVEVLAGCSRTFERNPGVAVMVEVAPEYLRAAGLSLDDLLHALPQGDRAVYVLDDNTEHANPFGPVRALDEMKTWMERDAPTMWYSNLLSVVRSDEARVVSALVSSTD